MERRRGRRRKRPWLTPPKDRVVLFSKWLPTVVFSQSLFAAHPPLMAPPRVLTKRVSSTTATLEHSRRGRCDNTHAPGSSDAKKGGQKPPAWNLPKFFPKRPNFPNPVNTPRGGPPGKFIPKSSEIRCPNTKGYEEPGLKTTEPR